MTDPATKPPPVDWSQYRACGICKVRLGEPCISLSGRVVDGRPDGVRTVLTRAHGGRRPRRRR
jgi:hypothetical protein